MSAAITAAVGGAVVSGYMTNKAAKKSTSAQGDATAAQAYAAEQQLDFEKEKLEKWEAVYGKLETNLGEFYQKLTPNYIETQGLQAQQQEFQKSLSQIRERFAQLDTTKGAQADIEARAKLGYAEKKAEIRAEAPLKAAQQKQSFLALGRGIPTGVSNVLATQTQQAGQADLVRAQQAADEAAGYRQTTGQFATLAGSELAKKFASTPTTPIPTQQWT